MRRVLMALILYSACGLKIDRDVVQKTLSELNPIWWEYLHDNIRNGVSAS